jgi:hypothetical protein
MVSTVLNALPYVRLILVNGGGGLEKGGSSSLPFGRRLILILNF